MATSIFSKLSRQSRHRDIFDGPEGTPPPGNYKAASTLSSLSAMGMTLTVTSKCCKKTEVLPATGLAAAFGPDALLASIRFQCASCGAAAFNIGPTTKGQDADILPDWLIATPIEPLPKPDSDWKPRMGRRAKPPREVEPEAGEVEPAAFDATTAAARFGDAPSGGGESGEDALDEDNEQ